MITKAHITRRAAREGVPAITVERDYVLAHVVASIAALKDETNLVFKGGTALRLCHINDYRYSADLDFSLVAASREHGHEAISRALESTGGSVEELRLTDDTPPRVTYLGPLGRQRTIKLDLADDELVLNTEYRSLLPRWPDLPTDVSVLIYTLEEIAGEKLRCVLQRLQCRDLFDLFLLFEEAQVDAIDAAAVFAPKAEHKDIDPSTFAARYRDRIDQYQKRCSHHLRRTGLL